MKCNDNDKDEECHIDGLDEGEASVSSSRAKARWDILRRTLLRSRGGDESGSSFVSIHRFGGFAPHLLRRRVLRDDIVEYKTESNVSIVAREFPFRKNVHRSDLVSQEHHDGVDNTGNLCVWDSEGVLAYCLTQAADDDDTPCVNLRFLSSLVTDGHRLRIVELGAGMAGLAGLALYSTAATTKSLPPLHVLLTDGHPQSVDNNLQAIHLTTNHLLDAGKLDKTPESTIRCQRLLWHHTTPTTNEQLFDVCLVSDCVHFQHYHAALLCTIGRLLRVGGVCILCQPHRGTSLTRFMTLIRAVNDGDPLFSIQLQEHYSERIWNLHLHFLQQNLDTTPNNSNSNNHYGLSMYDPSIHYPLLLLLTKKREFIEPLDTQVAQTHLETRMD